MRHTEPTETQLSEQLLDAWIGLSGLLKLTRLTQQLTYNEAIVLRLVYRRYAEDGEGRVSMQHILRQTNMLKSLLNRTVDALCDKGFLVKERGQDDRRSLYVRPVIEQLPAYEAEHAHSMALVRRILLTIGEADAAVFIRCCNKLIAADFDPTEIENGDMLS